MYTKRADRATTTVVEHAVYLVEDPRDVRDPTDPADPYPEPPPRTEERPRVTPAAKKKKVAQKTDHEPANTKSRFKTHAGCMPSGQRPKKAMQKPTRRLWP